MDVRWAGDHSVYLAVGQAGTFEVPLGLKPPFKTAVVGATDPAGFWLASRVAVSSDYLVVSALLRSLTWQKRSGGKRHEASVEAIPDIDVYHDRLLVLGARFDDKRRLAPDGAIAWLGSLDQELRDWKPVLFSASGPGAQPMNACSTLELGAVRFLADGSFLVVPGVEPGAFLYDSQGKLLRTWDTVALGLDAEDCPKMTYEQQVQLANPDVRFPWLNRRRTLDDILPLPQGPGLVVRSVAQGRTHWILKVLKKDGGVETFDLPVPSATALSHLRGDRRGRRLVLLVSEYGKTGPSAPARLVLAELTP